MPDKGVRPSVRASEGGVLIDVHVIPSAKEESVRFTEGTLRIKVKEHPEKGKATKAVLRLLRPILGPCEVVLGQTSRNKTILVKNGDFDSVMRLLDGLTGG